jgi:hypothetical protein
VARGAKKNGARIGFIPKDHPEFAEIMTMLGVTEPGGLNNAPR